MSQLLPQDISFIFPDLNQQLLNQVFEEAIAQLQNQLKAFANLPESESLAKMRLAFGDDFEEGKAIAILNNWKNDQWEDLPSLEFVSSTEFNGAFSRDTGKIYLSEEFVTGVVSQFESVDEVSVENKSLQKLVAVLIEEIGHGVEAKFNEDEIAGDEGAIFSALVKGEELSHSELEQLSGEDDTSMLVINNQNIEVEKNIEQSKIDALLFEPVLRWDNADNEDALNPVGGNLGSSVTISYSFMTNVPSYYDVSNNGEIDLKSGKKGSGFEPFSDGEKILIEQALKIYERVANITFHKVESTANSNVGGTINFGSINTISPPLAADALAYAPGNDKINGDVWMIRSAASSLNYDGQFDLSLGTPGFSVLLHEIGHALGLKHPFDGNNTLPNNPDNNADPSDEDNYQYTIMSYDGHPGMDGTGVFVGQNQATKSLLLYDIAAIQYLYGANENDNTHTGDNTYSWENNETFIEAIWDGDGDDKISGSNQDNRVNISLLPGTFSSIGLFNQSIALSNLAIADNVIIENAEGGSGYDNIVGNQVDNKLTGGKGFDQINGLGGQDTAVFSDEIASYDYKIDNNELKIIHARGTKQDDTDTLKNIEILQFSDKSITVRTIDETGRSEGNMGDLIPEDTVPPDDTVTLNGKIQWTDYQGNRHPARNITVKIWDDELTLDDLVATVKTDENGNYSASFDNYDGIAQGQRDIYIEILAEGDSYYIEPEVALSTGSIYSLVSPETKSEIANGSHNISLFTPNNINGGQAFNIAEAMYVAEAFAKEVRGALPLGSVFQRLEVNYPSSGNNHTYILSIDNEINLSQDVTQQKGGWDTILHEFGHYLASLDNLDNSDGGEHFFHQSSTPSNGKDKGVRLAWSEGLATYLSFAIQSQDIMPNFPGVGDTKYDLQGSGTPFIDFESSQGFLNLGEGHEIPVGRILWDLADGENEPHDSINLGHVELYKILNNEISNLDRLEDVWEYFVSNPNKLDSSNIQADAKIVKLGAIFEEYDISPQPLNPDTNDTINTTQIIEQGSSPLTFKWFKNNSTTLTDTNDSFQVIIFNDDFSSRIFTSPTITSDSATDDSLSDIIWEWTPTESQWQGISNTPGTYHFVITGSDLKDGNNVTYPIAEQTGAYWSGSYSFQVKEPDTYIPNNVTNPLETVLADLESALGGSSTVSSASSLSLASFSSEDSLSLTSSSSELNLATSSTSGGVFGTNLPILGDILAGQNTTSIISNIRSSLATLFQPGLQLTAQEIADQLSTIPNLNVTVVSESENGVEFALDLDGSVNLGTIDVASDLGLLDQFGLNLDTSATVALTYNLDGLKFGVSQDQAYIKKDDSDLEITVDVGLAGGGINGHIGCIPIAFNLGNDLNLAFDFNVDLGSFNHSLDFSNLGNISLFNFDFNLPNVGSIQLPGISGDLTLNLAELGHLDFSDPNFDYEIPFSLSDLELDLGSLYSGFLSPILGNIDKVFDPIRPLINVLYIEIPIVSKLLGADFLEFDGKPGITFRDLAEFEANRQELNVDFGLIDTIIEFAQFTGSVPSSGGVLDFGDIKINNLGQINTAPINVNSPSLNLPSGFDFPLLNDPLSFVYDLVLGNSSELITYRTPAVNLDLNPSVFVPIIGPLGIRIGGNFGFDAQFGFGFDTHGLLNCDPNVDLSFEDGFYITDTANLDGTGEDIPEAIFTAGIGLDGEINLIDLAQAGVGADINGVVNLNLNDPSPEDGKIRLDEIDLNNPFGNVALDGIYLQNINAYFDTILTPRVTIPAFPFPFDDPPGIQLINTEQIEQASQEVKNFTDQIKKAIEDAQDVGGQIIEKVLEVREQVIRGINDVANDLGNLGTQTYNKLKQTFSDIYDEAESVLSEFRDNLLTEAANFETNYIQPFIDIIGFRPIVDDLGEKIPIDEYFKNYLNSLDALTAIIQGNTTKKEEVEYIDHKTFSAYVNSINGELYIDWNSTDSSRFLGDLSATLTVKEENGKLIVYAPTFKTTQTIAEVYKAKYVTVCDDLGLCYDEPRWVPEDDETKQIEHRNAFEFDLSSVTINSIHINGTDYEDKIFIDKSVYKKVTVNAYGGNDQIQGGSGDDVLRGGSGWDQIFGGEGSDVLEGNEGNDVLVGEGGSDLIYGGSGEDTLEGGDGQDTLKGGVDNDTISGGADNDTLEGEDGSDRLFGQGGSDFIRGGNHTDYISGGENDDELYGDSGDDNLFGEGGFDDLYGGSGQDYLDGGDLSDNLYGDSGNDSLIGGKGFDELYGGADNDLLEGGEDNDYLDGESGNDELYGDNINPDQPVTGNDILKGGSGDDYLKGGLGNDNLNGEDDADWLEGDQGNDTLRGGNNDSSDANDVLYGGLDDDTLYGGNSGEDKRVYLDQSDLDKYDILDGGDGVDELDGESGADYVYSPIIRKSEDVYEIDKLIKGGSELDQFIINLNTLVGSTYADTYEIAITDYEVDDIFYFKNKEINHLFHFDDTYDSKVEFGNDNVTIELRLVERTPQSVSTRGNLKIVLPLSSVDNRVIKTGNTYLDFDVNYQVINSTNGFRIIYNPSDLPALVNQSLSFSNPEPDVEVQTIRYDESADLDFTVTNLGNTDAGQFKVDFYLSEYDDIFDLPRFSPLIHLGTYNGFSNGVSKFASVSGTESINIPEFEYEYNNTYFFNSQTQSWEKSYSYYNPQTRTTEQGIKDGYYRNSLRLNLEKNYITSIVEAPNEVVEFIDGYSFVNYWHSEVIPIIIEPPKPEDLSFASFYVRDAIDRNANQITAKPGQLLDFDFSIQNTGDFAIEENFVVGYYLSTERKLEDSEKVFNSNDYYLGSYSVKLDSPLATGEVYVPQREKVLLDAGTQIYDGGSGLGIGAFDGNIITPDTFLRFTLDGGGNYTNQPISISLDGYRWQLSGEPITDWNQDFNNYNGSTKTYEIPVGEYLAGTEVASLNFFNADAYFSQIYLGEPEINIMASLPDWNSPIWNNGEGTYYLHTVIDANHEVGEGDGFNNWRTKEIEVELPLPDLSAYIRSFSPDLYVGESFNSFIRIANGGNATSLPTTAKVYINGNGTSKLIQTFNIPAIDTGKDQDISFELFLPEHDDPFWWTYSGIYDISVVVDPKYLPGSPDILYSSFEGTNESNNVDKFSVNITRTDKPVVRVEKSRDDNRFTFKVNQDVTGLQFNYRIQSKGDYLFKSLPAPIYDQEYELFYTEINDYIYDDDQGHFIIELGSYFELEELQGNKGDYYDFIDKDNFGYYDAELKTYKKNEQGDESYFNFTDKKYYTSSGIAYPLATEITSQFVNKYHPDTQGYYDSNSDIYYIKLDPLALSNDSFYSPSSNVYSFPEGYYSLENKRFYTNDDFENSSYHDPQTNTYTYANGVVVDPNTTFNSADYYFDISLANPDTGTVQYYDPNTGYYHLDTDVYYDPDTNSYHVTSDSYGSNRSFDVTNNRLYKTDGSYLDINNAIFYESDGSYADLNNYRFYESNGNYVDLNTGYFHYVDGGYFDINSGYYYPNGTYYQPPVDEFGYESSYNDPAGGSFDGYSYTPANGGSFDGYSYYTSIGGSLSEYEYSSSSGDFYSLPYYDYGEYYLGSNGYVDSEGKYWSYSFSDNYFDPNTQIIYNTFDNTETDLKEGAEVYQENGIFYHIPTGNSYDGTYYYRPDGSYYDETNSYFFNGAGGYYDPSENLYQLEGAESVDSLSYGPYFNVNTGDFYFGSDEVSENPIYFNAQKNRYQYNETGKYFSYLDPSTNNIIHANGISFDANNDDPNFNGSYFNPVNGYYYQNDGSYVDSKNGQYHVPNIGYVQETSVDMGAENPPFYGATVGQPIKGLGYVYYDLGGGYFFEDDPLTFSPNHIYYLPTGDYYDTKTEQFYSESGFYYDKEQEALYYDAEPTTENSQPELVYLGDFALPKLATINQDYQIVNGDDAYINDEQITIHNYGRKADLDLKSLFDLEFDPNELMTLQITESNGNSSDYLIGWSPEVTKYIDEPRYYNDGSAYFEPIPDDVELGYTVGTINGIDPEYEKHLTYYFIGAFLQGDIPDDLSYYASTYYDNSSDYIFDSDIGIVSFADHDGDKKLAFAIDKDTGVITVSDPDDLDYDIISRYNLAIAFTDGSKDIDGNRIFDKVIVDVGLLLGNRAPYEIQLSNKYIPEKTYSEIELTTGDRNPEDTHTYTLVNDAGGRFIINENKLQVKDPSLLDFEQQSIHKVKIRTTDSRGLSYEQEIEIFLEDLDDTVVNDAPITVDDSFSVNEDNSLTGNVLTNDTDVDDDNLNAILDTDVTHGSLTLNPDGTFSYTPTANYNGVDNFSYYANDGQVNSETPATVNITINPINDSPIINSSNFEIAENETEVGTIQGSDDDGDDLTYHISGGVDGDLFQIDSNTGDLSFISAPDYENPNDANTDNSYQLEIIVNDRTIDSQPALISVNVTDVNENNPPIINSSNLEIAENETEVGTIQGSDDDGDALTYSISGGVDKDLFQIDSNTGDLNFKTAPDYENPGDANTDNSYQLEITVNDGIADGEPANITIAIKDINENPTAIELSNDTIDENLPENTIIGTLSTVDEDLNDTHTYSLINSASDAFSLDDDKLLTNKSFDYESQSSYDITIKTTDNGGLSHEQTFTVSINDIEETNPLDSLMDIDGDGKYLAAVDGLLFYGYLNIRGLPAFLRDNLTQQLADNLINPESNPTRTTGQAIASYLESDLQMMDIDGDGKISAAIDGLLGYGYLNIRSLPPFLRDNLTQQLANNLIPPDSDAIRQTGADISAFIESYIV